ncbi:MAG: porin OmpL1, partial [Leptonema sp. (in: Bacteria)]|nr:porin OmpL1 [Leptonema sp. (in: bacteria)]
MKLARKLIALAVVSFVATSVHAEGSYLGLGLGLQFDLGSLAGTITKDGLSANDVAVNKDISALVGQPAGTVVPMFANVPQKVIMEENKLDVLSKTPFIEAKQGGAMTGLVLTAFYEKEWTNDFIRVGADYTTKIMGGRTEAKLLGLTTMDITWNYQAFHVPFYYGLKAGVGENASVYGGLGLHYYKGGWGLKGMADGQIAHDLAGLVGSTALAGMATGPYNASNIYTGGAYAGGNLPVHGENIQFDVSGIGFNFIIGLERKLQSGVKTFFEIDFMVGAK